MQIYFIAFSEPNKISGAHVSPGRLPEHLKIFSVSVVFCEKIYLILAALTT